MADRIKAIVYGQEGCAECERIAYRLACQYDVEEVDIEELTSGARVDMDAMVQLAMQNNALPVINIGGVTVHKDDACDMVDVLVGAGEALAV